MPELSGRLSERARFERRSDVRGQFGEQSEIWDFVFERWVEVKLLTPAEPLPPAADTRHVARRWRLTMRDGRRPLLDMRILWRDQVLAITGVVADPQLPGWLTVWAEDFAPAGY